LVQVRGAGRPVGFVDTRGEMVPLTEDQLFQGIAKCPSRSKSDGGPRGGGPLPTQRARPRCPGLRALPNTGGAGGELEDDRTMAHILSQGPEILMLRQRDDSRCSSPRGERTFGPTICEFLFRAEYAGAGAGSGPRRIPRGTSHGPTRDAGNAFSTLRLGGGPT